MIRRNRIRFLFAVVAIAIFGVIGGVPVFAQRIMERLDRGLVAVDRGDGVFLSWRFLATDPEDIAFDVYRDGRKITESPLTDVTNLLDATGNVQSKYTVQPVLAGSDLAPSRPVSPWTEPYLNIALQTPRGYQPNDSSVGDLDGDGQYEIVVHQVGRSRDNSQAGQTDPPIFEAYEFDGTLLWRINLGRNIRDGAHYTQFMVYDLDCDGRAEFACKTADGTCDGRGKVIGDGEADWVNRDGKILDGPEFFTIFDGLTGAELATADYLPPRGDVGRWGGVGGNGGNDSNGNRVDRFLACVAYLDGRRPSVVMCRGYYGRSVLAAWDWRDRKLSLRWVFDSAEPGNEAYSGQGNHNLSVADVDEDGRDEIIYGAMAVDDDGTGLYSTGLRHGDAIHVGDLDPQRPGLEVWGCHEIESSRRLPGIPYFGTALFDARTGEIIWARDPDGDVGRCMAADIDPDQPGVELWGGRDGLMNCRGEPIRGLRPSSTNFGCWWDGDLLRELLNGTRIDKPGVGPLHDAVGCRSNNGSKSTPALSGDILGDWREEVIFPTVDGRSLRIYTTTIETSHRLPTLMHDPQYRLSIAWQNVGYNQPPHVGYFLGEGMKQPRQVPISLPQKPIAE